MVMDAVHCIHVMNVASTVCTGNCVATKHASVIHCRPPAFSVQVYQSQLHTIENLCIVNSQFCTFIAFEFPVVDVIKHCFQLVGYFPLERGGRSFVSHPFMPAILTATTVASDACAAVRFVPHIRYSIGSSSSDGDSTCVSFFKRLVTTTYPATPTATHRRAQAFVRVVVSSP